MAAPNYNFNDPALKPWHLKASYQLYDAKGNPSEQGIFEYWWASPNVSRSTWTRGAASHTDWHTADGKNAYLTTGAGIEFFESKLRMALLDPLPDPGSLDPAKFNLDRDEVKAGTVKMPCVMPVPKMDQHGQALRIPLGLFPTYCFDPVYPALRITNSFGTVAMEFNRIVKIQGKFLPREIDLYEGKRKILSATVDQITMISAANPAFTPDPQAHFPKLSRVDISAGVAVGMLEKKVQPVYPQDAKDARVSGTVVLKATIGRDGNVHDLSVVSGPWPSLIASAMQAVSQWHYRSYMLNGEPVEVETTINVIFSLG